MCTGIDYLSPHLSHFTSVLSLIFLRDLKNVMKAAPPNLYQRLRFRKALGHVSILVSRARSGRGGTEAREVPSAAAEQLTSSALFSLGMPCWEGEATVKTGSLYSIS